MSNATISAAASAAAAAMSFTINVPSLPENGKPDAALATEFAAAIDAAARGNATLMAAAANAVCQNAHGGNAGFAAAMLVACATAFKASPIETGSIRTRWNGVIRACTGLRCYWSNKEQAFQVKSPDAETYNNAKKFWQTVQGKEWTAELPAGKKLPARTNLKRLAEKISGLSVADLATLRALLREKGLNLEAIKSGK